jgi:DNA topoisomerase I
MAKNLVIVESPAKAKTIEKFLGKDYSVKSSFGHVRDLPKKGISIDIEHDFAPTYEISPDKKKIIAELKKAAKDTEVWLASDEDREGEAIAWHLCEALKLDPKKTKRIVFHEITKTAIEHAVQNPRTVDMNLVDAQQARRILDRIVGYELSPVLWKKVRPGLSAGRVQSVAVRLVVEREREIKDFESESSFRVLAGFLTPEKAELPAELKDKLKDEKTAEKFLLDCADAQFTVKAVDTKPGTRSPGAPFTTSTLQQEASRKLGYSVKMTMTLAQRLYEHGHITYMRTDSTILSGQAIKAAEEYIRKEFGDKYHQVRQYKTKSASAQQAHEAIRPTHFQHLSAGQDEQQKKLYELIWKRTIASQMAAAEIDRTEILIDVSSRKEQFIGKGEIVKFDGFFKVYGGGKEDVLLPPVSVGEKLDLRDLTATETFTKPPARYSEASLVKKLEELGIGRPSTYAPTISTVQTRGYIEKKDLEGKEREIRELTLKGKEVDSHTTTVITGADRNKLLPTGMADVTTDFLVKHFKEVLDYDFTAHVEEDFDEIADGKRSWEDMLKEFYKSFQPLIKKSESVTREETSQARVLGKDPKSGKPVIARYGRFGPMLQKGEVEDEEKPDFAPLPEGVDLEDVTFEQAMEMFKLPRTVGMTEQGEEIKANIGRFGPYIQIGKLFVSIKPHDPMKITEAEARELYAEKLKKEAEKHISDFGKIKVLNGMYGPYVTDGKKNARIPKETDAKKLTEAEAKKILDEAPAKKGRFKRRPAAKK